jgi:hypothetical protein
MSLKFALLPPFAGGRRHFIEKTAPKSPSVAVVDVSLDSTLHVGEPEFAVAFAVPVQ